jgi:energy-coupling factor transporter transmembrane protein EcfT
MIILALALYIVLTIAMLACVIFFENDCKKIILWNLIIVFTSIFGFLVYFIWFCDKPKLKKSIKEQTGIEVSSEYIAIEGLCEECKNS